MVDTHDLTVKEFADRHRLSIRHVYRLISEGALETYKIGRSIRIKRESSEALRGEQAA